MLPLPVRGRGTPEQGQCGLVAPSTGASCPPSLLRAQLQFSILVCVLILPLTAPLAGLWPCQGNWLTALWSLHRPCTQALMTSVLHSSRASWHREISI